MHFVRIQKRHWGRHSGGEHYIGISAVGAVARSAVVLELVFSRMDVGFGICQRVLVILPADGYKALNGGDDAGLEGAGGTDRIYLGKDGERLVILLSGGTKKRQ